MHASKDFKKEKEKIYWKQENCGEPLLSFTLDLKSFQVDNVFLFKSIPLNLDELSTKKFNWIKKPELKKEKEKSRTETGARTSKIWRKNLLR